MIKIVAALMAATLAALMTACSDGEPAPVVTSSAPGNPLPLSTQVTDREVATSSSDGGVPAGDVITNSSSVVLSEPVPEVKLDAVPPTEPETRAQELAPPPVRDAKEAAEDAARKILDATVGAAEKLKEVGMSAVQSVRDTVAPASEPAPPISEADPVSEPAVSPTTQPPTIVDSPDKAR